MGRGWKALTVGLVLSACGASSPPPTVVAPTPCRPSSYVPQPLSGARTGMPDPTARVTGTNPMDGVHAVGLAIADAAARGHCPQASTITTTGAPAPLSPVASVEPTAEPLAFAAIDEAHFACVSVSGLDDLIVAESLGDAAHVCEEMTGEPCHCTAR